MMVFCCWFGSQRDFLFSIRYERLTLMSYYLFVCNVVCRYCVFVCVCDSLTKKKRTSIWNDKRKRAPGPDVCVAVI